MKALTVKQPWATLIMQGIKDREYRSWATPYRGRLAIHAGQALDLDGYEQIGRLPGRDATGALLGTVMLMDVRPHAGGYAWVLADPQPLPRPVPYRGQLSLFDVPDGLVSSTLAAAHRLI